MVTTVVNSIFPSNTYMVNVAGSGHCLLIDPGLDQHAIEAKLKELRLVPRYIFSTHGHFDHVGSVSFFQKKYKSEFYIHSADLKLLQSVNFFLKMMKLDIKVQIPLPDIILKEDAVLQMDGIIINVYNLKGHTEGSCIYKIGNNLFTGDIIYSKGVGYNPFPGQDKKKLQKSVRTLFEKFENQLMVYPGHGKPEILGNIKLNNIELKQFLEVEH